MNTEKSDYICMSECIAIVIDVGEGGEAGSDDNNNAVAGDRYCILTDFIFTDQCTTRLQYNDIDVV